MIFEDDVFISYRHQNNDLKDDKGKGWVDHFHERLEKLLTEILGYKPRVWRDSRMPGNVYIAGHLHQQLKQTRIIVSLLSPGYVKSDWCMGELQEFCRLAQENGGLEINGKQRVFKIVKIPVPDPQPPEVKDQVGYSFYVDNQATGLPEEFGHELGQNKDQRYWNQLSRLAWGIKDVLDSMKSGEQPARATGNAFAQVAGRAVKGIVYLAETTSDLRKQREEIESELKQHSYEVLPDRALPTVSPDYEQAVQNYLARAKLSIHLLGSRYAGAPEGNKINFTQLQLELALQRQDDPRFARLIWMSPELQVTDTDQETFIQGLQDDSETQKLADLRIEKLADLKTFIIKTLEPPPILPSQKPVVADGDDSPVSVYLVYHSDDGDEATEIETYLFDQGYEVLSPLEWSQRAHESNLEVCDSLLVYHGKAHVEWLAERRTDFIRARGLRGGKKFYAKAFYLTSPEIEAKKPFRSNDALVLRNFSGFDPATLAEFISEIKKAKGAAQ